MLECEIYLRNFIGTLIFNSNFKFRVHFAEPVFYTGNYLYKSFKKLFLEI